MHTTADISKTLAAAFYLLAINESHRGTYVIILSSQAPSQFIWTKAERVQMLSENNVLFTLNGKLYKTYPVRYKMVL